MSSEQKSPAKSLPSNLQTGSLQLSTSQLKQLPPRPEMNTEERSMRPAAEISVQYPHYTLQEQKCMCEQFHVDITRLANWFADRLRFCKEKIDCCRATLKCAVDYLDFNLNKESDIACFKRYTTCVSGVSKHIISEEEEDKTRKDANRAVGVSTTWRASRTSLSVSCRCVYNLYNRIEGNSHDSSDDHMDDCKYIFFLMKTRAWYRRSGCKATFSVEQPVGEVSGMQTLPLREQSAPTNLRSTKRILHVMRKRIRATSIDYCPNGTPKNWKFHPA
jgi:hypothetical protein